MTKNEATKNLRNAVSSLLDKLKEVLEAPEKTKNRTREVYKFAAFRHFTTSTYLLLHYLCHIMDFSSEEFEGLGFQRVTDHTIKCGIIDRSDAELMENLGSTQYRLMYYDPDIERNDEDLLHSLPKLEALMRKIVQIPGTGKE